MLKTVCDALLEGSTDVAADKLRSDYPFLTKPVGKRCYGKRVATRVFIRDGFIDRYSGQRLVFPPVLRVISMALPDEFPYQEHWRTAVTHPAYGELSATVDHVVPVSDGGSDEESNLVTTSMARNSAKLNWSLEQLGWTLLPEGEFRDWDGLVGWFLDYTKLRPESLVNRSIRAWHNAARAEFTHG